MRSRKILLALVAVIAVTSMTRRGLADVMYAMQRTPGTSTGTLLQVTISPFAVTPIGSNDGRLSGIDFQPGTNVLFGASANNGANPDSLFTINVGTGAAMLIGGFNLDDVNSYDLAFDNGGTLFGTSRTGLYRINTITGQATVIGDYVNSDGIEGLAVDPTTNILYAIQDTGRLYSVDKSSGLATLLGVFDSAPNNGSYTGFGIDSAGNFYLSTGQGAGQIYALDPSDFSVTLVGDAPDGSISDIAFMRRQPNVVPEPASLAAWSLMGLILLGVLSRCKVRDARPTSMLG